MHILVTRAEADAEDFKSRIAEFGCAVSVASLIDVELEKIPADAVLGAAAIIATSRNGLAALAQSPALPEALKLPLYAVGSATAARGKVLGFSNIVTGPGSAAELAALISAQIAAPSGPLIHLAGDHLAFDLKGALAQTGLQVIELLAYRSVAAEALPATVKSALAVNDIDAVILMSPRTARTWIDLVQCLPQPPNIDRIIHICLSDAVAKALLTKTSVKFEIAKLPNSEGMLALVQHLASQSRAQ